MKHDIEYYYGQDLKCPTEPLKPILSKNANSAQVLVYAKKLAEYEVKEQKYKKELAKYTSAMNKREDEFKSDLFEEFEMTNHPNVEKIYSRAWSEGHSSGLQSVHDEFSSLVDLVK